MDGALKSWAVTKGPSLIPTEKRLAVHVEDHPLEYGAFEGTIPKDQYGGGEVLLWDRGHWRPAEDPHKGYAKGHLKFYLEGEKLKGLWHLVRLKKRDGDRQEPWLLIKSDDDAARRPGDPDILEEMPLSVTTNRSIEDIANGIGPKRVWNSKPRNDIPKQRIALDPPAPKPLLKRGRAKLPDFTPPCLATLRDSPPLGGDWIHEIKFDGYRTQARMQKSAVQILTRSGLDWTHRFKPIANALAQWSLDRALLDGEIVLEDENGVSNFSALQAALKSGQSDRFVYYVFDLLHLDGNDLSRKPLIERKALLEKLIAAQSPTPRVRYSEHFEEDATAFFKHACKMSLEGIISKRTGAPYRSGRNADWLKIKCTTRQEFVIIGYNSSGVAGRPLRSLAIGYYEGGALRYAGNVGTGYSEAALRDLGKLLLPLRIDKSLIKKSELPPEAKGTHWVRPQLVAEIEFSGFTGGNVARHAAFKGLRDDKRAEGVVREMAAPKPIVEPRKASRSASNGDVVAGVRLTHPDRLYWPDPGIDKRELARFYEGIWDWIAPHVVERPLSLLRCPDGLDSCFFQKHIAAGLDQKVIGAVRDPGEKDLLMIDDLPGLIALVQAGVLEIHVWGAKAKDIESCDRIVFDLDPGDEVSWREVIDAAREIRERLNALKLESFVKTSGGKGLHVVLPITGADWTRAKDFAHAIALSMAADAPNRYTTNMAKRARLGRIFIDYLRNGRGATSICAYSTRARPGAAVSVPIEWPELMAKMSPDKFNVRNLQRRLKTRKQDPWEAMAKLRQRLSK